MEKTHDVEALRRVLRASRDDFDRSYAATALGRLDAREAADDLLAVLRDDGYWVQLGAIDALGRFGDERALGPAVETLWRNDFRPSEGNDAELLDMLTDELARMPFAGTIEALGELLRHESPVVRFGATQALGKLSDPRAEPLLRRVLDDADEDVRYEARLALAVLAGDEDVRQL
jgi:HEAT repeat protein